MNTSRILFDVSGNAPEKGIDSVVRSKAQFDSSEALIPSIFWKSRRPFEFFLSRPSDEHVLDGGFDRRVVFNDSSSLQNHTNREAADEFARKHTAPLLDAIRLDPVAPGEIGRADAILAECLAKNVFATTTWLSGLFTKNFSRPAIATDILLLVGRQSYEIANPSFVMMAVAGLSHRNRAVQEAAIRAFENWGRRETAETLRSVRDLPGWLQNYLDEVVTYLEAEN